MSRLFLGIDVGGTAARWVAVDETGADVDRGIAGGATGHLFALAERARFVAMAEAIAAAVPAGITGVQAGVTGLGNTLREAAAALLAQTLGIAPAAVAATDDIELAYHAAFAPGEGHLVAAGTGSIGLHLPASGAAVRVGGRGLLIDDGGSGTWIALSALDALYRQVDMTGDAGPARLLAEALHAAVGGSDWEAVRAHVYGSDRGRIGALATAVAAAAAAGDPVARRILLGAAEELSRLGMALVGRVGLRPLAFVGGVIELSPLIAEALSARRAPLELRFPSIDAAARAAQLARERAEKE